MYGIATYDVVLNRYAAWSSGRIHLRRYLDHRGGLCRRFCVRQSDANVHPLTRLQTSLSMLALDVLRFHFHVMSVTMPCEIHFNCICFFGDSYMVIVYPS